MPQFPEWRHSWIRFRLLPERIIVQSQPPRIGHRPGDLVRHQVLRKAILLERSAIVHTEVLVDAFNQAIFDRPPRVAKQGERCCVDWNTAMFHASNCAHIATPQQRAGKVYPVDHYRKQLVKRINVLLTVVHQSPHFIGSVWCATNRQFSQLRLFTSGHRV